MKIYERAGRPRILPSCGDELASASIVCYKYGGRLTGYRGHASPGQIGQ